jgi:septal ring factor EnvC (AmiA/AmiB activator)
MVEEDLPEYEEGDVKRSTGGGGPTPEKKTFMANTIVPNTSTMVEEDSEDELQQQPRTTSLAPSIIASTKSLSPPIFKSNAFSNANGARNRSISPPPVLPKSRAQIDEQARRDQQVQDKMDEYEDQIEALKERIAELQGELKSVKLELQEERSKPPPTPPPNNDRRLRDLEEENADLKDELREQQEVLPHFPRV